LLIAGIRTGLELVDERRFRQTAVLHVRASDWVGLTSREL